MIIKGASVFCEDGTFQVKDVFVEDHKIVATEAEVSDKTVVDANGYKLIPGLVDVHSHGACGHDFCDCDVEGVKEILRFEKELFIYIPPIWVIKGRVSTLSTHLPKK